MVRAANHTVNVTLTNPIFEALIAAVLIVNKADAAMAKDEHRGFKATTPSEYVEELILTNLAERGLLRQT